MSPRSAIRDRYSFANLDEALPLPDLIAIQRTSFEWFLLNGLRDTFHDISPIKDFTETLQLELEFDPDDEDLRPPPKFSVEECKEKDMTFSAPIFVRARFINANTGEIKEQTVFMGDFPMMTDKGTFVINGTERVVVSQLVRSPGVIFQPGERFRLRNLAKHQLVTGTIHPYRGEWIEFDVEQKPGKDVTAGTRVARKRRLSIFVLLRALGYDEENAPGFLDAFVRDFDFLEGQWEKDEEVWQRDKDRDLARNVEMADQDRALIEIYKRARPGEPPSVESAKAYFRNAFFEPRRYDLSRVGRYKLNRKLGPELEKLGRLFPMVDLDRPAEDQSVLSQCEVLATTTYLLHLVNAEPGYRLDDQDHFANRRIRSVGELIQNQVRIGLSRMERVVRERMTTQDVEAITPQTLINIRPVVAAIKEFFGTSQLSQFMDQVNPLSGLTHRRRLSALGPGGLSRERAGFEVRDVHFSHYGRMCPIETPEGPNIGLIGALATFARVNEFGFIESPYRKVVDGKVTDEIIYLPADEEEEYVVAQANAPLNADGTFQDDRVLVRRSPQAATLGELKLQLERDVFFGATTEICNVPPTEVHLMDVSPKQIVSVATSLIPFLEHDDANRALMGANMQKQAVPLLRAEAPYIGTGIEARAARDAADMIIADGDGDRHRGRRQPARRHLRRLGAERRRPQGGSQGLPAAQVRALEPGHLHQPEAARARGRQGQEGRHPRRRPLDRQRRAGPRQEPARRLHAVGGLQLRGRHHPLRAPGARRRAHLDPHPRARDRRPRHQARPRGDHPGHPEPLRGDPGRPRRARHHPHRRRGQRRRRAGRQGHAQGRDRAHPRGAPAARHLRREGPRGPRHLPEGAPRRRGQGHRRQGVQPRREPRAAPRRQPAGAGLRRPEAQDQRGRQAGRPPRQQGRHLARSCRSRTCPSWPTAPRSTSS